MEYIYVNSSPEPEQERKELNGKQPERIYVDSSPEPEQKDKELDEKEPEPKPQQKGKEPDDKPEPLKSSGGRKKKPVNKPPVPSYVEIRKMQWPRVKWYIDHYMYGEVKNIDNFDVITLQKKLQNHIQEHPDLKREQNDATMDAKEDYENAKKDEKKIKEDLKNKRFVARELVTKTKRAKNELAELKRDFPTLYNTAVCFQDTTYIINAKSAAAAQLADKAQLAAAEVSELERSLKEATLARKEVQKLVK